MRDIDPIIWARTRKEAGPRLEAIRRSELLAIDIAAVVPLTDAVMTRESDRTTRMSRALN